MSEVTNLSTSSSKSSAPSAVLKSNMAKRNTLTRTALTVLAACAAIACWPTLSFAADTTANAGNTGPIRIGVIVPLTGGAASYGPGMANAAKALADKINAQDGGLLNGRKIEIVVADDESNPTAGVAAANKLIDVEHVVAIGGVWSSAVAMAIKPIAVQRGVALMVVGSGDETTEGDNHGLVWRFQARGSDWGGAFARTVLKDGAKKVSLLVLQSPYTISMVQPFIDGIKKGGGTMLDTVYYNPGQTSYRAEVDRVFSKHPDAVFVPAYLPDFSAIAKEVYRGGYKSKLYTISGAADSEGQFAKNVGNAVAEGISHVQSIPPTQSTAYQTFLSVTGTPKGTLSFFASNVYDQIAVTALAIEKSKSTDASVFTKQFIGIANGPGKTVYDPVAGVKAIRQGEVIRYSGAGSDFHFTPTGDQLNREYGHFVLRDGKSVLVDVVK